MWLNFTKSIMIIVFLSICVMISGCVDEPAIDPIKIPFSVTRIGNFSSNVAAINVSIDGKPAFTIQQNKMTDYFDITSGKRKFHVTNADNGDVLYDKEISMISYEESSIYFGGYFSKNDLENTFSPFYQSEGDTYVLEHPHNGMSYVYFADMSSDIMRNDNTGTAVPVIAKKYQISAVITQPGKADTTISITKSDSLAFGKVTGAEVPAGAVRIAVVHNTNSADTIAVYNGNMEAGYRYFFYLNLTGVNSKVTLAPDKQILLPVRPK